MRIPATAVLGGMVVVMVAGIYGGITFHAATSQTKAVYSLSDARSRAVTTTVLSPAAVDGAATNAAIAAQAAADAAAIAAAQAAQAAVAAAAQAAAQAAKTTVATPTAPKVATSTAPKSTLAPKGTPLPWIPSSDPNNALHGNFTDPGPFCASHSGSTINGVPQCD